MARFTLKNRLKNQLPEGIWFSESNLGISQYQMFVDFHRLSFLC
jgi:hypothetical protein